MKFNKDDPLFIYVEFKFAYVAHDTDQIIQIGATVDKNQLKLYDSKKDKFPSIDFERLLKPFESADVLGECPISDDELDNAPDASSGLTLFKDWLTSWKELLRLRITLIIHDIQSKLGYLFNQCDDLFSDEKYITRGNSVRCSKQIIKKCYCFSPYAKLDLNTLSNIYIKDYKNNPELKQKHLALPDAKLLEHLIHAMPDNEMLHDKLILNSFL